MLAASFCVGVRLGFFSDLEGVLVAVSATTVVTPATVRGRIGGERGRRGGHEISAVSRFRNEGLPRIGEIGHPYTVIDFFYIKSSAWVNKFAYSQLLFCK